MRTSLVFSLTVTVLGLALSAPALGKDLSAGSKTSSDPREHRSLKTSKLRAPSSLGGQGLEMLDTERLPEPEFLREDGRKNAPKRVKLRLESDLINPYTPGAQPQMGIGLEAKPGFKAKGGSSDK